MLRAELRKIEAKKKEREKKTADLQKLIAQVDSSAAEVSSSEIPYSLLAHHLVHQLFENIRNTRVVFISVVIFSNICLKKKLYKKQKLGLPGRPRHEQAVVDQVGQAFTLGTSRS